MPIRGAIQTLVSDTTQTDSGDSGSLNFGKLAGGSPKRAQFLLDVTDTAGTSPTLDVYIQWTPDGGTTWVDFLHFTQATTTSSEAALWSREESAGALAATGDKALAAAKVLNGPISDSAIRVAWVIGGTSPSFEFNVLAISDQD